jgi:hypothetical protein
MFFSDQLSELSWQGREAMKEIDDRPHLLVRIEISGAYFPHRAPEPFVKIVSEGQAIASWFAEVSDDNHRLVGYFPTDLPQQGMVEFGYGSQVLGRLPVEFESGAVNRLDREQLPEDVVVVSAEYLKTKR